MGVDLEGEATGEGDAATLAVAAPVERLILLAPSERLRMSFLVEPMTVRLMVEFEMPADRGA